MGTARYGKAEAKDAAREMLRGIMTAICLPIDAAGEIDEAGLRHDIRHCIDVIRTHGLYLNGNYGHYWLLTSAQRRRVIEIAVDEAAGAVPIINRCAHPSATEATELALHAQEVGADFISLVIPQFGGSSEEYLYGYFAMIAREIELGITIFNTAQAGYTISPEMMARLAEIPNICALKNHRDLEHTRQIRELVGDTIVVVDPQEENFLTNFVEAGQTAIYTGTNMMFDSGQATPMRDYFEAALAGDTAEATRMYDGMQPLRDLHQRFVLEPWDRMGVCPISIVKYWSGLQGMTGGEAPEPMTQLLSEGDRDQLRVELAAAQQATSERIATA